MKGIHLLHVLTVSLLLSFATSSYGQMLIKGTVSDDQGP